MLYSEFSGGLPLPHQGRQIETARVHLALDAVLQSPSFRSSKQCQALLRYIVEHTLAGEDHLLRERVIGANVFNRAPDYDTGNDPVVRARAGEVRKRLAQHYLQEGGGGQDLRIDIPSGSYQATFEPLARLDASAAQAEGALLGEPLTEAATEPQIAETVEANPRKRRWTVSWVNWALMGLCVVLAAGWIESARTRQLAAVPWPINQLVNEHDPAMVVLADASYTLRLLGDKPVTLDEYLDRSFIKQVLPPQMTPGEARLFGYLSASHITSIADAHAAAALTQLAGTDAGRLSFRSARDLRPQELTHGNLIFVGASSSNPWVQLYEEELNFHVVDHPDAGGYRISNRAPQAGERDNYKIAAITGTSGEDYATIALLPNREGNGRVLIIQGLRMEGTEAAIHLLLDKEMRKRLQTKLEAINGGQQPEYFEALLHAQSVAGAPIDVECVAARIKSARSK